MFIPTSEAKTDARHAKIKTKLDQYIRMHEISGICGPKIMTK
jgi:hypothetical protein